MKRAFARAAALLEALVILVPIRQARAQDSASGQMPGGTAASEFDQAKRTLKGFAVESADEFLRIKRYREELFTGAKITHGFKTEAGQLITCIEISSQPSLKGTGLGLGDIQLAPDVPPPGDRNVSNSGAANPADFGMDGSLDEEGNVRTCPRGSIPLLGPSLEDLCRFKKLVDLFQKYPPSSTPIPSVGRSDQIRAGHGPPGPSRWEPPSGHEYAHAYEFTDNQGEQADFNIWQPYVEQSSEFSLSQLWVSRGSGTTKQTAETGWQVYYQKYGDWRPHLFIFTTRDGYTTGYYNRDASSPFVQTDRSVVVGGALTSVSAPGGPQYSVTLTFYRDQGPKHNWWLRYGSTWVGYYPNTWFNSSGIADKGDAIDYGGEVFYQNVAGLRTTTDMGSGQFPATGLQHAAFVKCIKYADMTGTFQDATGLSGDVSDSDYYDIRLSSSSDTNWLQYYFFGGPGRVVGGDTWTVWPATSGGNDHLYRLTPVATNWAAAESIAESWGGTLAAISSAAEQMFINNTFFVGEFEHYPLWVGLNDLGHKGTYNAWVTGEPVVFKYWKSGEPNNYPPGEDYIAANWEWARSTGYKGTWNDTPMNGTTGFGGNTDGPYFGLVEMQSPPRLAIAPANGKILISWPVATTNFVLEAASTFSAWATVTNQPVMAGTNLFITNSAPQGSAFYRLRWVPM